MLNIKYSFITKIINLFNNYIKISYFNNKIIKKIKAKKNKIAYSCINTVVFQGKLINIYIYIILLNTIIFNEIIIYT